MGNPKKRKARERAVKKRLARERHLAQVKRGLPPSPPTKFTQKYGDSGSMAMLGPILKATWFVPDALEAQLRQNNLPVSPPVFGYMLIDTGAANTCIALDVAQELGLTPTGIKESYGSHGKQQSQVFAAKLKLSIGDQAGNQVQVEGTREVIGIPELGDYFKQMPVQDTGAFPWRLIGLIGRDFLAYTTFTYRGSAGEFEFKLDLGSFPAAPQPAAPAVARATSSPGEVSH